LFVGREYKARVVAQGFTQIKDYDETFSAVANKFGSLHAILALAAEFNLEVRGTHYLIVDVLSGKGQK
jgi:hypothetical protein